MTQMRRGEELVDVVVVDYLEKAAASARQLKMFGANHWQREADNVESLKNFAESMELPVVMVTQLTKFGKTVKAEDVTRNDIGGSGEKSTKANLVVLLRRDKADGGGYSNIVRVNVDKNTMGADGVFLQYMQPEFFRLTDLYDKPGGENERLPHTTD